MLNLFNKNKQLLDEDIIEWIFNAYAWAFEQFDKDVFFKETELVIPNNKYFPGSETTAEGMANLIFDQVKGYAGMTHWPTRLFDVGQNNGQVPENPSINISGALRGKNASTEFTQDNIGQNAMPLSSMPTSLMPHTAGSQALTPDSAITFTYHPQQLKSPEGVIAHFAHGLSFHLASAANTLPPGGQDYLHMAGELTGIFMGFGLMFANSAVIQRSGGCGGCGGGQSPVREVFMNEEEAAYALAVFCQLKGIDRDKASKHLKKHLRGFFKDAVKDCKQRMEKNKNLKLKFSKTE